MKIVNREQFLALPENTVYSVAGKDCHFWEDLYIKGSTWKNDWMYLDLINNVDACDSNESSEIIYSAIHKGTEFRNDDTLQRDGMYDENDMYVIFDDTDVRLIISLLQGTLTDTENEAH